MLSPAVTASSPAPPCTCKHERHALPAGVDVRGLTVYSDASGAPAVVRVGSFAWAFDCLGSIRCNFLGGTGSRVAFQVALEKASRAYAMALGHATDGDWIARNAAMYASAAVLS